MNEQEHETGPPKTLPASWAARWTVKKIKFVHNWAASRANWPRADREDFASEVITRLVQYEQRNGKIKHFNAFTAKVIFRAAHEESEKSLRHGRQIDFVALEDVVGESSEIDGADSFTISDLATDLDVALDSLAHDLSSVIICRLVEGLSQDETAAALDIPVGTVASRQHRGLERLRNDPTLAQYNTVQPKATQPSKATQPRAVQPKADCSPSNSVT